MSVVVTRQRALRAALAVTLGGIAACGDEAAGAVDSGGHDVAADGSGHETDADDGIDHDTTDVSTDVSADADGSGALDVVEPTDADADDVDEVGDGIDDVAPDADDAAEADASDAPDVEIGIDGTDDVEEDDGTDDADVAADADADENAPCKAETSDNVCPSYCDQTTDWDCCDNYCGGPGWGSLDVMSMMCFCAVEGPFAPPSFDGRRARPRTGP